MRSTVFLLTAFLALMASAERYPFDRYQPILDRQMFGSLPLDFDPTKLPSEVAKAKAAKELKEEQEKLKSAVHFSVINVRADGKVEVGFTDSSDPKTPHHYFICEGETAGGWTVAAADPDTASMTIVKNGIQLELTLGDNSATGAGNASKVAAAGGASGARTLTEAELSNSAALSIRARRNLLQLREAEERRRLNEELQALRAAKDERQKQENEKLHQSVSDLTAQVAEMIEKQKAVDEKAAATASEGGNTEENKAEPAENEAN